MMPRYRKKPIVVEAEQTAEQMVIQRSGGIMVAEPGDYIVTGIMGERYPVKAAVFEQTYELEDE